MDIGDIIDDIPGMSNVDVSEDHLYGHGFDPSVCEGCPKKEEGVVDTCGICGCPLFTLEKVKGGSPPESCIRLEQHSEG